MTDTPPVKERDGSQGSPQAAPPVERSRWRLVGPKTPVAILAVLGVSVALAACGSSKSSTSAPAAPTTAQSTSAGAATSSTTTSSSTTASTSGGIETSTITETSQFAGVKPGKANTSLAPLTIGFTNQEGSAPSFGEMSHAAEAVVGFINDHLGGVGGHPLKLDKCVVLAEEDGQKCAANFLNAKVTIADQGTTIVGNATYYKTVAGKFPIIVSGEGSLADITTPHVYLLDGGGGLYLAHMMDVAHSLGAKTMALILEDTPAGHYGAELMIAGMKKYGMKYKVGYVPASASTPNFASALQAAGASSADMVAVNLASVNGCISVYDAMKQLGIDKKVVSSFQCYGEPWPKHVGEGASNWYFTGFTANPRVTGDPEVNAWRNVMTTAGQAEWEYTGDASKVLQDMLLITKFANELGYENVTGEAMDKKILAYDGKGFTVPGTINCSAAKKPEIGICGNEAAASTFKSGNFVTYEG